MTLSLLDNTSKLNRFKVQLILCAFSHPAPLKFSVGFCYVVFIMYVPYSL